MKITFGLYTQVHTGTDKTTKSRTVDALQAANERGGHCFTSLLTNRELHAYNWTNNRVEELGLLESQPLMANGQWPYGLRASLF
jgi:hypothetical protein